MALTFRKGAFVPGTTQNFTTSGSSQASAAFSASTSIIRISVTTDTYVQLGAAPTATTASMLFTAGTTEFLAVDSINSPKIAFIQVTTAGVISITELA